MPVSRICAFLPFAAAAVWAAVTDLTDTAWRSDLAGVETLPDGRFVEYARGGAATEFTVTACVPCRRWEFDLKNRNLTGHWTGLFEPETGGVRITFVERVALRRRWMTPLAALYLWRRQRRYLDDLRKKLARTGAPAPGVCQRRREEEHGTETR